MSMNPRGCGGYPSPSGDARGASEHHESPQRAVSPGHGLRTVGGQQPASSPDPDQWLTELFNDKLPEITGMDLEPPRRRQEAAPSPAPDFGSSRRQLAVAPPSPPEVNWDDFVSDTTGEGSGHHEEVPVRPVRRRPVESFEAFSGEGQVSRPVSKQAMPPAAAPVPRDSGHGMASAGRSSYRDEWADDRRPREDDRRPQEYSPAREGYSVDRRGRGGEGHVRQDAPRSAGHGGWSQWRGGQAGADDGHRTQPAAAAAPPPPPAPRLTRDQQADTLVRHALHYYDQGDAMMSYRVLSEASQLAPLRGDIKQGLSDTLKLLARTMPPAQVAELSTRFDARLPQEFIQRLLASAEPVAAPTPTPLPAGHGTDRVAVELPGRTEVPQPAAGYQPQMQGRALNLPARRAGGKLPRLLPSLKILVMCVAGCAVLAGGVLAVGLPGLPGLLQFTSAGERQARELAIQVRQHLVLNVEEALPLLEESDRLKEVTPSTLEELRQLRVEAHRKLGVAAFGRAAYDEAITHFEAMTRHDPENALGFAELGAARYIRVTNASNRGGGNAAAERAELTKALEATRRSLELSPGDPRQLAMAAQICVRMGEAHNAYQYWREIIRRVQSPNDPHRRAAESALRSHGQRLN